ncbi:hypothetical protein U1Q18_016594 [Sarracenia purpurea var. burkii]
MVSYLVFWSLITWMSELLQQCSRNPGGAQRNKGRSKPYRAEDPSVLAKEPFLHHTNMKLGDLRSGVGLSLSTAEIYLLNRSLVRGMGANQDEVTEQ